MNSTTKKRNNTGYVLHRTQEKRREISRCAARQRREKEADVFKELENTVPTMEGPRISHVDRIALLRLTASLFRFRGVANTLLKPTKKRYFDDNDFESPILNEVFNTENIGDFLSGFLLVLDAQACISYISPNVARYLGLGQTDLIGHDIYEFLNPDDVQEMRSLFMNMEQKTPKKVLLRLKSVLGARGRNLNLRSALFKPVYFTVSKHHSDAIATPTVNSARSKLLADAKKSANSKTTTAATNKNVGRRHDNQEQISCDDESDSDDSGCDDAASDATNRVANEGDFFLMYGAMISQYGSADSSSYNAFVTRHSMDMKFSYCHEKLSDYLGYDIKSLIGLSFYSMVHPEDLANLTKNFRELYRKQQVCTGVYRLMAKHGGYVYLISEASVVTQGSRTGRGQHIVCIHQVVSVETDNGEILADVQQYFNMNLMRMGHVTSGYASDWRTPDFGRKLFAPKIGPDGSPDNFYDEHSSPLVSGVMPLSFGDGELNGGSPYDQQWLFRGPPNTPASGCSSSLSVDNGLGGVIVDKSSTTPGGGVAFNFDSAPSATQPIAPADQSATAAYCRQSVSTNRDKRGAQTAENSPIVPTGSVGTPSTQASPNSDLYPVMPDAGFLPAKNGMDKLDDLSFMAPYVDTGDLMNLDLAPGELEVDVDFNDFKDMAEDMFSLENKAKSYCNGANTKRTRTESSHLWATLESLQVKIEPGLENANLNMNTNTQNQLFEHGFASPPTNPWTVMSQIHPDFYSTSSMINGYKNFTDLTLFQQPAPLPQKILPTGAENGAGSTPGYGYNVASTVTVKTVPPKSACSVIPWVNGTNGLSVYPNLPPAPLPKSVVEDAGHGYARQCYAPASTPPLPLQPCGGYQIKPTNQHASWSTIGTSASLPRKRPAAAVLPTSQQVRYRPKPAATFRPTTVQGRKFSTSSCYVGTNNVVVKPQGIKAMTTSSKMITGIVTTGYSPSFMSGASMTKRNSITSLFPDTPNVNLGFNINTSYNTNRMTTGQQQHIVVTTTGGKEIKCVKATPISIRATAAKC